jgi:membrane protein insertase Oxa1/YidC/SpoIIIJ
LSSGFVTAIPYLITMVLVMVTAYWQQKQTQARNQAQGQQQQPGQAVMKIFPLFFGFISFNLPAGLVVYFAASQVFRVGQQALFIRLDERAAESAGKPRRAEDDKEPRREQQTPEAAPPNDRPRPKPQGSKKRGKKRRRR